MVKFGLYGVLVVPLHCIKIKTIMKKLLILLLAISGIFSGVNIDAYGQNSPETPTEVEDVKFRPKKDDGKNDRPKKPALVPVRGSICNGDITIWSTAEGDAHIDIYDACGSLIASDDFDMASGYCISLPGADVASIVIRWGSNEYIAEL